MRDWLQQLETRDRRALLAAAVALVLAGFYFLLWQPHVNAREHLADTVREQRATRAWMEAAAREAAELREGGSGAAPRASGRSLLGLVDGTARAAALSQSITRMEPQGEDSVRLWLTRAPFDKVVDWLATLQKRHGIRVVTMNLEREKDAGLVSGRIAVGYTEGA